MAPHFTSMELEAIANSDNFKSYSKKMESQLRREKSKIHRNLSGIRAMDKLPGCLVVIDVRHELTALKAAHKLGIPTVGVLCGGFPADDLRAAGCRVLLKDPAELLARLEDSPRNWPWGEAGVPASPEDEESR